MTKSAMIRARIDNTLKEDVETILQELGLSTTQAITLFYQQVRLTRGIPFQLCLPNQPTAQNFADTIVHQTIVHQNSSGVENGRETPSWLGCMRGTAQIIGDIVSPLEESWEDWEVLKS